MSVGIGVGYAGPVSAPGLTSAFRHPNKIAAIAAGIDHRRRSGAGGGPGFDTAGEAAPRFLELARDALPRATG